MPGEEPGLSGVGGVDIWVGLLTYLVVLFSVTVHEFAHAAGAEYMGDPTPRFFGRLTLNPLPHMNLFGTVILPLVGIFAGGFVAAYASTPVNPALMRNPRRDDALVAAAGPFANLLVVAGAVALARALLPLVDQAQGASVGGIVAVLHLMALLNGFLFLFNLMPIPPLDGSHLLESALSERMRDAYRRLAPFGLIVVFALVFTLGRYVFGPMESAVTFLIFGSGQTGGGA